MSRLQLKPHPATARTPLRSISAEVIRVGSTLSVHFVAAGGVANVVVPAFVGVRPADRLWEHTCFEAFVRLAGSPSYFEFNFAPSGAYAVYGFDDYRKGMRSMDVTPHVDASVAADELRLTAALDVGSVDPTLVAGRLVIAVPAVIEDSAGARTYWALEHPTAQPDFHHRDAFRHTLESAS